MLSLLRTPASPMLKEERRKKIEVHDIAKQQAYKFALMNFFTSSPSTTLVESSILVVMAGGLKMTTWLQGSMSHQYSPQQPTHSL
jgi:hypothetical protein